MKHVVTLPPDTQPEADGTRAGGWWHTSEHDDRIVCDLCPRACQLPTGARGFCFVRENRDGRMVLSTYGRSTGFCVDPIEKKPLNHFFPGTSVLSFGTAGCNLGCQFCQNWSISKSREIERLSESATPEAIAQAAVRLGCKSVAFTYNDPVIWAEYAIDVAKACREVGVKAVAVTAGYITEVARGPFYSVMDAANVDLKAFTEDFYQRLTLSHLAPVLETLRWLKAETDVWFEITNLVIPRANDSPDEFTRMCDWMLEALGDGVPVHFTAFHPDFRLRDRGRTPHETLLTAYRIARRAGLKYVYVGNVNDVAHQSTYCPHCGEMMIERDWYSLGRYHLRGDRCQHCGGVIAGRFDDAPGQWGRRRLPVRIADFAPTATATAPGCAPAAFPSGASISTASARVAPPAPRPESTRPDVRPDDPTRTTTAGGTTTVTTSPPHAALLTGIATISPPALTAEQERAIHHAASAMVAAAITRRPLQLPDPTIGGAAKHPVMGAFVSLKRRGQLRGCCGTFGQASTLADAVHRAATRTATEDTRLPAVSATELGHLDLEVWLLDAPKPMTARGEARRDEVVIGRHGLYVARGKTSGLLLPGVAIESGVDAEGFLEQVCVKATLPPTAWKEDDVTVGTFEGRAISGPFDPTVAGATTAAPFITEAALLRLAEHCRGNLLDVRRGRTPLTYLAGGAEGTVHGLCMTVRVPTRAEPLRFAKLSLRPGLALQATLFGLAETAARVLAAEKVEGTALDMTTIDLTVLWDPAMHGTVAAPDSRGVDPATRALLVIEGTKVAWTFDPQASIEALLDGTARAAQVRAPASALVLSLTAASMEPRLAIADVPRAQKGPSARPPAVAGTFYPAQPADVARTVDNVLPATRTEPQVRPAIMVPHAALQFSGKIAAAVYARVVIPDTVIIVAPRHHRQGAEWAVAPHDVWTLPGATVASDPDLARELAGAIPDLELDAVAHQKEHSIEVQLPLIARLAPHARVVGIALGAGDVDRCRAFARGLADVLRGRKDRPLLVISTDLNHYATDAENRRLDAIALAAVERLDPAEVYETVQKHRISMCGLLPTVVVMETLRQLDLLHEAERVAYGTSADASGDTSRVVGYAGMLFR